MGQSAKVAVVGLGSVGSMALWQLAKRGILAEGFDTYDPGHDRGSAGGESRIFRLVYREGREYLPLLLRARELWRELAAETPLPVFWETGFLTIGPTKHPTLEQLRHSAALDGLRLEERDRNDVAGQYPEFAFGSGDSALFDTEGGTLRPELSVSTAVRLAERAGAVVHRYSHVSNVQTRNDHCVISYGDQSREFEQVILAPGPRFRDFECLDELELSVKRIPATWFPRIRGDLFEPDLCPPSIRVGTPAYSCFPAFDRIGVKVIHHVGFETTAYGEDPLASSEELRAVSAAVRETLPGVFPTPIRSAVYYDSWTPDGHSYLGRIRDGPLAVAVGFSGHGFKLAPALGEALADLVGGNGPDLPVAFLSPDRAMDAAST